MTKKKRILLVLSICLLAVGVLAVYPLTKVAVCFNPFDSGGCIAVAYDKAAMRAADRVVLCVGEDRYEITDADFVDEITKELMVATHTGLRYAKVDRWIEIYSGDMLVRRMLWAECTVQNGVFIYFEDELHPIYHNYPTDGPADGQISPSDELVEKLNAIIANGA
jgi:hypothetical protein